MKMHARVCSIMFNRVNQTTTHYQSNQTNKISIVYCAYFKFKKQIFHAYGLWIKMIMQPQM
jgi:uncharacterized protein with PQ loop repeat